MSYARRQKISLDSPAARRLDADLKAFQRLQAIEKGSFTQPFDARFMVKLADGKLFLFSDLMFGTIREAPRC